MKGKNMLQVTRVLRSSRAAIDLMSIMVGIIVLGIIGGVIAATVFAVIPWAQDNAAKQDLQAVKIAEDVYSGFQASPESDGSASLVTAASSRSTLRADANANYGTYKQLVDKDLIQQKNTVGADAGQDGSCYVAASLSETGKVFYLTNGGEVKQTTSDALPSPDCTTGFPVIEKLGNEPVSGGAGETPPSGGGAGETPPTDGGGSGVGGSTDCSHGGPNCGTPASPQFKFSVTSVYSYPEGHEFADGEEDTPDAGSWYVMCTQSNGGCEVTQKSGNSVVPSYVRSAVAKMYSASYVANAAADATESCGYKDMNCLMKALNKSFPESEVANPDGSRTGNLGVVGLKAISND
jgi:type II secretory pathway pseudopilin PulG